MALNLPLTDKQPERWPRMRIDQCFEVMPGFMTASNNKRQGQAGDIEVIVSTQGALRAVLLDADQEVALTGRGALMRPNGKLKPELMALILNQPSVQRSIGAIDLRVNSGMIGYQAKSLRELVIAVPDPQTQEMMWDAHQKSAHYLTGQADNFRKLASTMDQMGHAIAMEILSGKATPRQALEWVGKTMHPWFRLVDHGDAAKRHTSEEIAASPQPGKTFVATEDHLEIVAQLRADLAQMKRAEPISEPTTSTKRRSP